MKIYWSSSLYNCFSDFRQRPNIDLFQYRPEEANSILDLGCGNAKYSTRLLNKHYPNATITAVDYSENMLEQAKSYLPDSRINWIYADIQDYQLTQKFDIISLCSTLQWLKSHPSNIKYLFNALTKRGRLLIQMPNMFEKPFYRGILEVAERLGLTYLLSNLRVSPVLKPEQYDEIISKLTRNYSIWTTTYFQKLHGKNTLLEWAKGAPLRPVISILKPNELDLFYKAYNSFLKEYYIYEEEYAIIPFERIFLVAAHED